MQNYIKIEIQKDGKLTEKKINFSQITTEQLGLLIDKIKEGILASNI